MLDHIAALRRTPGLLAMAIAAATPTLGWSQAAWPDKPVRVIVPLPPGGPSDIVLRTALEKMQPVLKQTLVLDNKPGAAGNLGAAEAARAAPDGTTWLWTTDTLITVNPHVYQRLGFKPEDLQPVMRAASFSQTLVCHPAVGVKSVAQLVAKAKAAPMSYASGGAGSPGHLATELFSATAGITMTHVPYKGPAPAMQDVIGGTVECGFLAGPTVLPHVRSGRLLALAVSGAQRSALLPEVPTVAESGYPGFDATFSLVLFAPRGTSEPIVNAMHTAMANALRLPDVVEKLRQSDQVVVVASPAQTAARLAEDSKTWGAVARRIGLSQD
ncbi:MAG: tripartite tricarboxylate transporter substrate binding protein [Vitreoscilla sp.]|nr:tripartite tricarboxylate transporter substrate binding protein [Vitreoscilla sp.]